MKTEYIKVDFDKLNDLLKAKAGSINKASKMCGAGNALFNAKDRGVIPKSLTYALSAELGIDYKDYAPSTKCEKKEAPNPIDEIVIAPQISEEQWERLKDVIKDAVVEAMKEWRVSDENVKTDR